MSKPKIEILDWNLAAAKPASVPTPAALAKAPIGAVYFGGPCLLFDTVKDGCFAAIKIEPDRWVCDYAPDSKKGPAKILAELSASLAARSYEREPSKYTLHFLKNEIGAPGRKTLKYTQATLNGASAKPPKAFAAPDAYARLFKAGLVDLRKRTCIDLTDVEWMTPGEIAEYDTPSYQIDGLQAFAKNGAGDAWCWYTPWAKPATAEPPVVFAPHDEDTGTGYAPSFLGAIYRMILEEMAGSPMPAIKDRSPAEVAKCFQRFAQALKPFLPAPWTATLQTLADRPWKDIGYDDLAVHSEQEAQKIIRRDLAFPHLNKPLKTGK